MKKRNIALLIIGILVLLISSMNVFGATGFEYLSNYTYDYYGFNNGSLTSMKNGSHILIKGDTPTNVTGGIFGNAYQFDASSQDRLLQNWSETTNVSSYSVSMWINKTSNPTQSIYFGHNDVYETCCNQYLDWYSNTVRLWGGNPGTTYGYTTLNTWDHWVATMNKTSGTAIIYRNGVQVASGSIDSTPGNDYFFQFGGRTSSGQSVVGKMDEIATFSKVLTLAEVNFLYGNYTGGTPGTVTSSMQYPYSDGTTPTIDDYTFLNQTPSDITNTNLFTNGNVTIYYNVTKPNTTYSYINYSVNNSRNIFEIINGSVTKSGNFISNSTSSSGNITRFDVSADNGVYPSVNLLPYTTLNQAHSRYNITGTNDYLKFAIYNMSQETNQYLELDLLSQDSTCRIFYCNSSYSVGLVPVNANCFHFATSNNQSTYNHTHGSFSGHNLFNIPINSTGYVGNIKLSQNGYFLVNKQSGTNCNVGYVDNVTRTDTSQLTLVGGTGWSNLALTPDMHVHFFNLSYQDKFQYQVCAVNSTNTTCDSLRTDNLDITPFSPLVELLTPDDDTLNISSRIYNITWTYLLTGATNINFSVYLLDQNDSVIKNLSIGQGNSTSYNWDIVASQIPIGIYKIKVFGNDTNGLNSFDIGETFNLTKNAYFNISAKSNVTGSSVNNISGWFYNQNKSTNETFNTTTGTATLNVIQGDTYSIHVEPTGLAFGDRNFTMNYTGNYTFTLYTINSIDVKIYIEGTSTLLNQSATLFFVSSVYSTNRTTSNGSLYVDLFTPSEYNVIISSTGYAQKNYYFTLLNGSYNQITIYMSNTSEYTDVTANIIDEIGNGVDGAILKVLRYDVTTNTFKLVEMIKSNSAGQTVIHLKLATTLYQFIIEYQGVVKYTSSANGEYIYSTTLNFPIITGTISGDIFFDTNNIATDLYFDNSTNTFTCTYTDGANLLQTACLEIREISFRPKYPMQSYCVNSPSGTLFLSVINTTGTTYSATCYGLIDNSTIYFKSLNYGFEAQNPTSKSGLFIIVLIMMAFAFIGLWNLSVSAILFPLPLIFGSFMKIVPASVGLGAFGIELLMIIIVIVISDKV